MVGAIDIIPFAVGILISGAMAIAPYGKKELF